MEYMSPGRELDVKVAKEILNLNVWFDEDKKEWLCNDVNIKEHVVVLPRYSTNTDHSYRVMYDMQARGYVAQMGSVVSDSIYWRVAFLRKNTPKALDVEFTEGEFLAHAVCLAALATLDGSNQIEFEKREQ